MKIVFLEDEDDKFEQISQRVIEIIPNAAIDRKTNWLDYARAVIEQKYDLILLDLLVPRSPRDNTVEDHHYLLVETTRAYDSKSFKTPAIVLTKHAFTESDSFHDLNAVDINVITYNEHGRWREALKVKLLAAQPPVRYQVVIMCALAKEADAFEKFADSWGALTTISGLICREAKFGEFRTVIVQASRMGLVGAAVACSYAIERFEPDLICMSGICGGVPGEAQIYDLLVTQTSYQHDVGKWSAAGFRSEHYDLQLNVNVHHKLVELAASPEMNNLCENLDPARSEFPEGKEKVTCKVITDAVTSSGSAVLAEEGKTKSLAVGQRKLVGFDMEVYSVYEAARHAQKRTAFFAAKAVVDDGGRNKGDSFHRIACLLSAKFVAAAVRSGISNLADKI